MAVGDLNGDTFADLVVGANGSPTLVFINAGNNSLTGAWSGFGGGNAIATASTKALALGDVDRDGDLDLFAGNDGANALYLNDGTGTFTAAASTLFPAGSFNTTAVALADMNGDHRVDLIVASTGNELSGTDGALTSGSLTFTAASATFTSALVGRVITIGGARYTVRAAPTATTLTLDRKATADASALAWSVAVSGEVFLNQGFAGTTWNGFGATPAARFGGPGVVVNSLVVADFDGDGLADIVAGTAAGSANLLLTNRGGTGPSWLGLRVGTTIGATSDNTTGIALANVSNGSGPDLIIVNNGSAGLLYKPISTKLTRAAAANVSATLGTDAIKIVDGSGAFILTAAGLAGSFSGTVDGSFPGFDANVSIAVRINQTTSPVDETMELGGKTINVHFSATEVATAAGAFLQFSGSGVIKLGDFVEIKGSFTFGGGEQTVTDLTVFLGQGPAFLEDGSINPDARGVLLTNATLMAADVAGKKAFSAVGEIKIVGFPDIDVSGTVRVKFNETGAVQFAGTDFEVADGVQSRSPAISTSRCSASTSPG